MSKFKVGDRVVFNPNKNYEKLMYNPGYFREEGKKVATIIKILPYRVYRIEVETYDCNFPEDYLRKV